MTGINEYFKKVSETLYNMDEASIEKFISLLLETYDKNGTIYIFGNGGSAATASHFCGDLLKGASYGLDKRFNMLCLNDNIPALMAIANDLSYEEVFIEQLKNFLKKDDLVIGISGSGNSMNVVKAIEYAKKNGAKTVAFCGYGGGKIKGIADLAVHANIHDMEIAEDIHMVVGHCVKKMLIEKLHKK